MGPDSLTISNWLINYGGPVAAFGGATIVVLALSISQWVGARKRRSRFAAREHLSEREWFDRYLPIAEGERDGFVDVLRALGRSIGIQWTTLRPDDTFSRDFSLPQNFVGWDDLEDFESVVSKWFHERKLQISPWSDQGLTLGGFLELLRKHRCDPGQSRLS